MQLCFDVKRISSSLQELVPFRHRNEGKRQLQISEPFNFKKEVTILPGFSQDEISVLREQAAAGCVGIADNKHTRAAARLSCTPDHHHHYHRAATSHSASSLLDRKTTSRYTLSSSSSANDTGTPVSSSMSTRSLNRIPLPQLGGTFQLSMPVSPVSTISSSDPNDDFWLTSPVGPLSPRESPKSLRARNLMI